MRGLDGDPVAGAVVDGWQADTDGTYEAQLDVDEARLRAKYVSRPGGSYCVRTIAPKGYTIPLDGPVGDLIARTAISHFQPAHVHFLITAHGFRPLITHLFQQSAPYVDSDVAGRPGQPPMPARASRASSVLITSAYFWPMSNRFTWWITSARS